MYQLSHFPYSRRHGESRKYKIKRELQLQFFEKCQRHTEHLVFEFTINKDGVIMCDWLVVYATTKLIGFKFL
jgi:hypothetical protein